MRKQLHALAVVIAILAAVSAWTSAQRRPLPADPGAIILGADIGFNPEGWRGNARTGTWMVRIEGRWVEAKEAVGIVPAK